MPFNRTRPDLIATTERRAFVLQMRKAGYRYTDIAAQAVAKFGRDALPAGWDERYAYKDVKRELDRIREETREDAADLIQIQAERLEMVHRALAPRVVKGDVRAIDRWIRANESYRKLLGLDAPQRQEVSGPGGEPVRVSVTGLENMSDEDLKRLIE